MLVVYALTRAKTHVYNLVVSTASILRWGWCWEGGGTVIKIERRQKPLHHIETSVYESRPLQALCRLNLTPLLPLGLCWYVNLALVILFFLCSRSCGLFVQGSSVFLRVHISFFSISSYLRPACYFYFFVASHKSSCKLIREHINMSTHFSLSLSLTVKVKGWDLVPIKILMVETLRKGSSLVPYSCRGLIGFSEPFKKCKSWIRIL